MKSALAVASLFSGFFGITSLCYAGFFSDPVNVPTDRFHVSAGVTQSGVSLDTEYIVHGGDVGSVGNHDQANPSSYWNQPPRPKFVEFYLKLSNGKWSPITKNEAIPAIQNDYSIERFAFLFSPNEIRKNSKENPYPPTGNREITTSSRSAGIITYESTFSYEMNRHFEDNLVSLYTDRGCIVQSNAMTESNFVKMQCGCKTSSSDRIKHGYSFCTSHFNKDGGINVESIQSALKDAGGLALVISQSNQLKYNGNDSSFKVAESISGSSDYHQQYAAATTPTRINRFIDTYSSNDPDGLVPQAQSRLPQAKMEEYRNEYNSAIQRKSIVTLNRFITDYSDNDPDFLIPKAHKLVQALEVQAAEKAAAETTYRAISNASKAKEEEARLKLLENKNIGEQICMDTSGTIEQDTGYIFSGIRQYRTIQGSNHIVGFVEGNSGKKIQIRISGINFKGGNGEKQSLDELTNFHGGSTLKIGNIIWDSTYNWEGC